MIQKITNKIMKKEVYQKTKSYSDYSYTIFVEKIETEYGNIFVICGKSDEIANFNPKYVSFNYESLIDNYEEAICTEFEELLDCNEPTFEELILSKGFEASKLNK